MSPTNLNSPCMDTMHTRVEDEEFVRRPVFLQLAKVTQDCYNMDFMSPLSLLQAFAVAITRFDMY